MFINGQISHSCAAFNHYNGSRQSFLSFHDLFVASEIMNENGSNSYFISLFFQHYNGCVIFKVEVSSKSLCHGGQGKLVKSSLHYICWEDEIISIF